MEKKSNMKPGTNEAIIEGVLYEKIVRTFDDGAIAGELVIKADTEVDGETFTSIIPISFYTKPTTNAGGANPAYKGIKTIIDKAKSLVEAETDGDLSQVETIRLRNGTIGENMFYAQDDRFVSFTRIRGNFFDRVKASDCQPKANFKVKMIVVNMLPEEIKQGGETFETGRLIVVGNVVQYDGSVDEVKFYVSNKKNVDMVEKNWAIGETVNASGVIKYTTEEFEDTKEDDEDSFGEKVATVSTRRIRELIITGGSSGPVEGYDEDDISVARRERKMRIAALKEKQSSKDEAPATTKKPAAKAKADW